MTTTKPQKEKLHGAPPRLTPRPTAASMARAARNATNRNLSMANQRQSPMRSPPSPTSSKIKTAVSRNGQRSESKTEVINKNCESEIRLDVTEYDLTPVKQEAESFDKSLKENNPIETPQEVFHTSVDVLQNNCVDTFQHMQNQEGDAITLQFDSTSEKAATKLPQTPEHDRPQTPKSHQSLSRPQTPKLGQTSRPNTPKLGQTSRPNTPIHCQRHSTPVSRPNTPQRNHPVRPRTPLKSLQSRPATPVTSQNPPPTPVKIEDDLKSLYLSKQKQFHRMKKELDVKQQAVLELFDGLSNLREQMSRDGLYSGGEGHQKLVLFNVADWAPDEVKQLCKEAAASCLSDGAQELFNSTVPIDEYALAELDSYVQNIPDCFANLCLQAFTARQEIIDWVKDLIEKDEVVGNEVMEKIAQYNSQGLELCEALRELKTQADQAISTVTTVTKRTLKERSTLVTVGESLVREVAQLREDSEARIATIELREVQDDPELGKLLEQTRCELEEERASKSAIKDKLATTESLLRQTRLRVSKMDKQLREAEASISSLTGTVKSLEDQNRQREVQLEARARKLKESLKTGEIANNRIVQQRDSLQAEVNELKERIQSLTNQHKTEVQSCNTKLKDIMAALEEQKNISRSETDEKRRIEMSLTESLNNIEELRAKITELENNKPNPDLPTEREMDLWAELQATKDTLRSTEEEITACKREKVRFLESLTKIANTEDKVGMQQKLAAELLNKEEIIDKMQTQIRDLTKNIKLNEQKVIQYEQYVRDLQAHNRNAANCQESPNGISYQDLQQEIMNLKMNLLEAVHRNEEISEALMQKEQQLEQQDKTSRAQARVIKVREELINMLKNKETEQTRELTELQQDLERRMKIVDEVNKQIASKADEIQELFSTLDNKQQQIHRLEKIVLALEEQQRRAQAQRTRHEEKIAALEHELAAGNQRERKYLFF